MNHGNLRPRVGLVCNDDHGVFAAVAERLRERGVGVRFFEPGVDVDPGDVAAVDLLVNKKVAPASFRALARARSLGVPTWNGPETMLLGARFVGYRALRAAGFRVPATTHTPPSGDYVAKTAFDWHFEPDPVVNGEGAVYQPLLETDGVDRKYYAVDAGDEFAVRVLRATPKLRGEKEYLDRVQPDPALAAATRRLVRSVDAQAIGVDVVYSHGDPYAVDVNPAASFREAGLEDALAASMLSRLPAHATPAATRRGASP